MFGLQAAAGGSTLGVPITELALLNTFTLLLWQLKAVQQQDPADGQLTSADPAVGLGEQVLSFCLQLEGIFQASGDAQRLQDCVFRIQADVFLVFSSDKLQVGFGCVMCCSLASLLLCLWHCSPHCLLLCLLLCLPHCSVCDSMTSRYIVHCCITLSANALVPLHSDSPGAVTHSLETQDLPSCTKLLVSCHHQYDNVHDHWNNVVAKAHMTPQDPAHSQMLIMTSKL